MFTITWQTHPPVEAEFIPRRGFRGISQPALWVTETFTDVRMWKRKLQWLLQNGVPVARVNTGRILRVSRGLTPRLGG